MNKLTVETLLKSQLFKSQQDIQVYKRLWEKCEPFRERLEKGLSISNKYNTAIGLYPTTDHIGIAVIGANRMFSCLICDVIGNIIETNCFSSKYSLLSDTTQFSEDLTCKLRESLNKYEHITEGVNILFQRQPPILGKNSERIKDVLLYSEFIGAVQYECFQYNNTWPDHIHLSDIAYC